MDGGLTYIFARVTLNLRIIPQGRLCFLLFLLYNHATVIISLHGNNKEKLPSFKSTLRCKIMSILCCTHSINLRCAIIII